MSPLVGIPRMRCRSLFSFLLPLVICSEVEAEAFAEFVYSVLLKVGKSVLKMSENLWQKSLIITKYV
jgi:hypothetical protein